MELRNRKHQMQLNIILEVYLEMIKLVLLKKKIIKKSNIEIEIEIEIEDDKTWFNFCLLNSYSAKNFEKELLKDPFIKESIEKIPNNKEIKPYSFISKFVNNMLVENIVTNIVINWPVSWIPVYLRIFFSISKNVCFVI